MSRPAEPVTGLQALERHMADDHEAFVAGFTVYQLMAEHLMLHQYVHGVGIHEEAHEVVAAALQSEKGEPE